MPEKQKPKRYTISMSGQTYARLRAAVTSVSLHQFVDGILTSALDDPTILKRVTAKCLSRDLERG